MLYLWLKTFHLVGVVSWFAGLFYHGRLLVYHAEALASSEPGRDILVSQYRLMESRLLRIIMNPAMAFTLFTGVAMLLGDTGGSYAPNRGSSPSSCWWGSWPHCTWACGASCWISRPGVRPGLPTGSAS